MRLDIPDPTPLDEAIWALYVEMRKTPEGAPWTFAVAVGQLFPVRKQRAYKAVHYEARLTYNRAYKAAHPEAILAYRATHREEIRAYDRERQRNPERDRVYSATHREEVIARRRAYDATHREEKAAYNRAYNTAHREEKERPPKNALSTRP